MLTHKGSASLIFIIGILFIAVISSAGFYFYQSNKNKPATQPTESLKLDKALPESSPSTDFPLLQLDTTQKIELESDNYGKFIVSNNLQGDSQIISIKKLNGEIITDDLIGKNYEVILNNLSRLGLKGSGMIGYSVKSGPDDSVIILEINPADGSKFETEIDLNTGQIIETSFIKK